MSYQQSILGGLALLAAAILFAASTEPRAAEGGGFEGVSSSRVAQPGSGTGGDMIWRVNKQSGAVSICYGHNTRESPSCSPWSK